MLSGKVPFHPGLRSLPLLALLLWGAGSGAPGLARAEQTSPIYLIEAIRIRGNTKTRDVVILHALDVAPGERLAVDDPRFELSRFKVLALGFFSDVQLKLKKGSRRGRVILVVNVVERGTIILTDLFFGTSEATSAWGGIGLAENNFLGRGISLGGSFVLGADPEVERGSLQQALQLRGSSPRWGGAALTVSGSFLYLDGSEFFRRSGPDSSSNPTDFLSIRYRRIGGALGMGLNLARFTRLYIDYRGERVTSDIPAGAARKSPEGGSAPIVFGIKRGNSVLSLLSLTLELDTRSDPVLPHRGSYLMVTSAFSSTIIGSGYDYFKLSGRFEHYFPLRWGHVLAGEMRGGVIFGDAPFYEKFFIGDFNDLIPSRALGLNFSTLPSRDVFGTTIDTMRYEEIAIRLSVEYIIPWFRGGQFFYGGDFFINAGLLMLTSREGLRIRDRPLGESIPVDLTLDAGLRLDTRIGVFRLSIGNGLGRIPF